MYRDPHCKSDQLAAELQLLLSHPVYQCLQQECEFFGYTLKQSPTNELELHVGDQVFYVVEYLSSTAEDLIKRLLACYYEVGTNRIGNKRFNGVNTPAFYYKTIKNKFFRKSHQSAQDNLWSFYASLEDFIISLRSIRLFRAPNGADFTFTLFTDEQTHFTFRANHKSDLLSCFRLLRSIYLYELVQNNQFSTAHNITEDIKKDFAGSENISLEFVLDSHHYAYYLVLGCDGIIFNRYNISIQDLYRLQQAAFVANPTGKPFDPESRSELHETLTKFLETQAAMWPSLHLDTDK